MIEEIQELKLSGFTPSETYDEPKRRHGKVPSAKTVRKHYDTDGVPEDGRAALGKRMAFDAGPLRSAVIETVSLNPGRDMSSVYDVLRERFVETGEIGAPPGSEQALRHLIHGLREDGAIPTPDEARRAHDATDTPPTGEKARVDFGRQRCAAGLTVHFACVLPWHSRPLWAFAQDHKFNSGGACRVPYRSVRHSVPWETYCSMARHRAIGTRLHVYDSGRRYICTHVCSVK